MAAEYSIVGDGADAILQLRGRFTLARIGEVHDDLQAAVAGHGAISAIDLSGIERIDTVGAWLVERLAKSTGAQVRGASPEAEILIEAVQRADQPVQVRPDTASPLVRFTEQVGASIKLIFKEFFQLVAFFGEALLASGRLLAHPRRIRWPAVVRGFETVGVNALVIIGLMCFLIAAINLPDMKNRLVMLLSETSYSIYLCHFPILLYAGQRFGQGSVAGLATATAATLLLSFVTYKLVEKPGMRLGRLCAQRWQPGNRRS